MLSQAKMVMQKSLAKLNKGKANVYVRQTVKDKKTGVSKTADEAIYKDLPCRLSFAKTDLSDQEMVKAGQLTGTLFVAPDIRIPTGSKIELDQDGVKYHLISQRGKIYDSSGQYPVIETERWL